jgi:hypothetical protein
MHKPAIVARYYDPATGQFLTVDPKVASTLSPYGYVAGDPLNATDPSGEWGLPGWVTGAWNATGGKVVHAVQNSGLCLRNPFGAGWNSNSNGGCHTALSTRQGTQLIAATVVVAVGTVGTLGLGDMIAGGVAGDLASGTLLGAVNAGIGTVGAWSVLGVPATVGGIGVFWGYSAVAAGPRGCGS